LTTAAILALEEKINIATRSFTSTAVGAHGRARYSIISCKGVVNIDSMLRGAGALRLRFCTLQAAKRQHGPRRDDTTTVEHDYP